MGSIVPAAVEPVRALTHGGFLVYAPMFARLVVTPGGYDNVNPRGQVAKMVNTDGAFARLHAAHVNTMESWPFFAAAILAGLHAGVDRTRLRKLATLWLIFRTAYIPMYVVQNKKTSGLRSLLFLWSSCISMNLLREAAVKHE